ncbi:MAG: hypothetical protein V7K32_16765 [Nostoc sp.]|uniref:hypothetical protein n=1 Tax=Nostoc sp. TaxID=1180 RepID=UPI002FF8FF1D
MTLRHFSVLDTILYKKSRRNSSHPDERTIAFCSSKKLAVKAIAAFALPLVVILLVRMELDC